MSIKGDSEPKEMEIIHENATFSIPTYNIFTQISSAYLWECLLILQSLSAFPTPEKGQKGVNIMTRRKAPKPSLETLILVTIIIIRSH